MGRLLLQRWLTCPESARKILESSSPEYQKVAKNCQKPKKLLPKFQNLLPKFLDILK